METGGGILFSGRVEQRKVLSVFSSHAWSLCSGALLKAVYGTDFTSFTPES